MEFLKIFITLFVTTLFVCGFLLAIVIWDLWKENKRNKKNLNKYKKMTTKNEIFQFLKNILSDIGFDEITENQSLKNDIGLDSLDSVELIMKCENEFDISVTDSEIDTLETIEDIINLIISKVNNKTTNL